MVARAWTMDRRCTAALTAVDRLESELRPRRDGCNVTRIVHLCRLIEHDVGRSEGVGEKLGALLQQAFALEHAGSLSASEATRARLIFLISCESIRSIINRLRAN